MITKSGVCYTLSDSPFTYEWRGITYFFSSESHRRRFMEKVRAKEEWLDDSLSRRFKCTVHLPILANIQLYTQIETRGFYIQTDDGMEYYNPESIYVEPNTAMMGIKYGNI